MGAGFTHAYAVQTHVTHVAPEERGSAVALFATFLFLGQASGVWLGAQIVDGAGLDAGIRGCSRRARGPGDAFRSYLSGGT